MKITETIESESFKNDSCYTFIKSGPICS